MTTQTQAPEEEALEGWVDAGSDTDKTHYFDIKEDSSVELRFFPGTKSLAGKDFTKYRSVYFWAIQNRRDPEKTSIFPILSLVEKDWDKGGIISRTDPIYDLRKKVESKVKSIDAMLTEQKKSKAEIAKNTAPYQRWLKNHGEQGRYLCYAMDKNGVVGIARIAATVRKKLKALIKELEAKGITPIGRKGIFFKISRTGTFNTTDYQVEPNRIDREDGSSILDFHTCTNEVWQKVMALPDINAEIERLRQPEEVMAALAALPLSAAPGESNKILGLDQEEKQQSSSSEADGSVSDDNVGDFGAGDEVRADDGAAAAEAEAQAAAAEAAAKAAAAKAAALKTRTAPVAAAKAPATSKPTPARTAAPKAAAAPTPPQAESTEEFNELFPDT